MRTNNMPIMPGNEEPCRNMPPASCSIILICVLCSINAMVAMVLDYWNYQYINGRDGDKIRSLEPASLLRA